MIIVEDSKTLRCSFKLQWAPAVDKVHQPCFRLLSHGWRLVCQRPRTDGKQWGLSRCPLSAESLPSTELLSPFLCCLSKTGRQQNHKVVCALSGDMKQVCAA